MCVCVCVFEHAQSLSYVWLFATPWTVASQAPLSVGFSWQEYWSGLPLPSPGCLPDPGIEPESVPSPVLAGRFFTTAPPGKPFVLMEKLCLFPFMYMTLFQDFLKSLDSIMCLLTNGVFLSILRCAAAAKSLQSCSTLCDPIDGSPPGSPSLGFSKQEWSGLPFPSPMHESKKWKWSLQRIPNSPSVIFKKSTYELIRWTPISG